MPLSEQKQRFIDAYLVSLNATQAAIDAGYSPHTARVQGSRLLTSVDIAAELARRRAEQVAAADLSAIRVLEELRRVAMMDARSFFHADGSAKRPHELTPEQGAALAGFEVLVKNTKAGDGQQDTIHKFRLWDKVRALEMLAKHFALLTERVDLSGEVAIRWLRDDEEPR